MFCAAKDLWPAGGERSERPVAGTKAVAHAGLAGKPRPDGEPAVHGQAVVMRREIAGALEKVLSPQQATTAAQREGRAPARYRQQR
jgi:hypothetical protein